MTVVEKTPLYYTFGNHMHWVDMQWLWGYQVLPDSVRDMIHFCDVTGAKGNINFEGIGYEKMAVESPDALEELRQSVQAGQIEIVGASYGQPYGLFHGSESNVRQRIYGVRAVMKNVGTRPKTFWEEEFDFFPQLPQMLKGVGFEYASLFFQWTWHTPVVPHEDVPAIWWEGIDGSRILTATRNTLNLHQWPEDFAILLASDDLKKMPTPGIVQWLELMPSPDWMCRSELMLPPLQKLMADPRFDLRFVTLSEYLEAAKATAVPRRYTLGDVFHGMSLGKNGDLFRRLSRRAEQSALAAESISALAGLFGRPYPHWDVYPTWELEEAWRELLSAQHHDNDECEGLCGHVGRFSYERSLSLTGHVMDRSLRLLADRAAGEPGRTVVYNPLGWARDAVIDAPDGSGPLLVEALPPMGYTVIEANTANRPATITATEDGEAITLTRGDLSVTVAKARGLITQMKHPAFADGLLRQPLLQLSMTVNGQAEDFGSASVTLAGNSAAPVIAIERPLSDGSRLGIDVRLASELDAVDVRFHAANLPRPDGGVAPALKTVFTFNVPDQRFIHDHPYAVSEIDPHGTYKRKYPSGEWMTSPQWFEDVDNPFTALQLLDFTNDERGLLLLHDGSEAYLRDGNAAQCILTMYDPWDEDYFVSSLDAKFRILPHGPLTHAERWKKAQEFTRPVFTATSQKPGGDLPTTFGAVWCNVPNVAVTALYREQELTGAPLPEYAGRGMGFPYIVRLVEFNGEATTARVRVPGPVASAYRTNLMGETIETLSVSPADAPLSSSAPDTWSEIELTLRPHEIATVYLDLVYGRKVPRNLDEHRHIWATVHRMDTAEE